MTKGYIVLMKNGKIYKVSYSNEDSSPSELGVEILELFESKKLEDNFDIILPIGVSSSNALNAESLPDSSDNLIHGTNGVVYESINLTKDNLIANKNNANDFFVDYSYIYDINKDVLKIYHHGKLLYTIKRNDISLYKYIFKNQDILSTVITFDENKLSCTKDYDKEIKKLIRTTPSIEDIENIINSFKNKHKLVINNSKHVTYNAGLEKSYIKYVNSIDKAIKIKFIVSKYADVSKRWEVDIQLPWTRFIVITTRTERECNKAIINFVKDNEERLLNYGRMIKLHNDYTYKYQHLDRSDVKKCKEECNLILEEYQYFLGNYNHQEYYNCFGYFTTDELITDFKNDMKIFFNDI